MKPLVSNLRKQMLSLSFLNSISKNACLIFFRVYRLFVCLFEKKNLSIHFLFIFYIKFLVFWLSNNTEKLCKRE